ncbi:RING/U-box superfamily protein [Striga asiatica]|uniref:RING/U-box superfamily protein n=1 Tax=Striga asiatica TaxID=4170 RepID=A0A5A7NVW9_STRAF|nr:RING/U-box superfamily protein [Striga asiatica]
MTLYLFVLRIVLISGLLVRRATRPFTKTKRVQLVIRPISTRKPENSQRIRLDFPQLREKAILQLARAREPCVEIRALDFHSSRIQIHFFLHRFVRAFWAGVGVVGLGRLRSCGAREGVPLGGPRVVVLRGVVPVHLKGDKIM